MQNVFETSIFAGNPFLLAPLVPILILLVIFIRLRKKDMSLAAKKVLIAVIVLSLIQLWFAATQVLRYKDIVGAYQNGKYLTVSGEVQEYIPPASRLNTYEQFYVNEIEFSYGGGFARDYFGYDQTALDGGAITRSGIFVCICYIPYNGSNIIVRLDVQQ